MISAWTEKGKVMASYRDEIGILTVKSIGSGS